MKILTRTPIPSQLNFLPPFYPSVQVTNEKAGTPVYKPLSYLAHYEYWRPNDFSTTALIVVDIDIADTWHLKALEKLMITRNYRPHTSCGRTKMDTDK